MAANRRASVPTSSCLADIASTSGVRKSSESAAWASVAIGRLNPAASQAASSAPASAARRNEPVIQRSRSPRSVRRSLPNGVTARYVAVAAADVSSTSTSGSVAAVCEDGRLASPRASDTSSSPSRPSRAKKDRSTAVPPMRVNARPPIRHDCTLTSARNDPVAVFTRTRACPFETAEMRSTRRASLRPNSFRKCPELTMEPESSYTRSMASPPRSMARPAQSST